MVNDTAVQSSNVRIKCKRCGKPTLANDFVVDYVNKTMVCGTCAKNPQKNTNPLEALQVKKPTRDAEDEKIDRAYYEKKARLGQYKKIDDEKIRYQCAKCKYSFPYQVLRGVPNKCPNCSLDVHYP